jgi:hypothetical protein
MIDSSKTNDFKRRTIRIHKILDDKVSEYQKEELFPTWTEATINLIKRGLEQIKQEKKRW